MDKFLQHEGIETGYFEKRKAEFNTQLAKGISSVGVESKVQAKPKAKAPALPKKPNDINSKAPNQLTGQDFVERMKKAKEEKAKKNEENSL